MLVAQLSRIGLPYYSWKGGRQVKPAGEAGKQRGMPSVSSLSDHLLRDVGLLDGHESVRRMVEPARSARDMIDRYR